MTTTATLERIRQGLSRALAKSPKNQILLDAQWLLEENERLRESLSLIAAHEPCRAPDSWCPH
jgi:hypothetical protein